MHTTSNQQQCIDMLPIMHGHPAMSASLCNLERRLAPKACACGMHMGCQTDLPSMCHIHHIHSVIGIPIQHEVESEEHAVIGQGLGLIQGHKVGVACAYKKHSQDAPRTRSSPSLVTGFDNKLQHGPVGWCTLLQLYPCVLEVRVARCLHFIVLICHRVTITITITKTSQGQHIL